MALVFRDRVWNPETDQNADWWGSAGDIALLLDGAAPLASEAAYRNGNDPVWLVRRFAANFAAFASGHLAPPEGHGLLDCIELARGRLSMEYSALCEPTPPDEPPFACLCLARFSDAALELYNMGDCTVLVRLAEGRVERFGTSAVRELDRQAIEHLTHEIIKGTPTHAERVQNVRPHILANRALRNQLPGYDVLAPDVATTGRLEQRSIARAAVESVLMLTDGFYRLVDTYHAYTDDSLFQAVAERGLGPLLAELRAIERADPECIEYPRFKREDDATALWLGFG